MDTLQFFIKQKEFGCYLIYLEIRRHFEENKDSLKFCRKSIFINRQITNEEKVENVNSQQLATIGKYVTFQRL